MHQANWAVFDSTLREMLITVAVQRSSSSLSKESLRVQNKHFGGLYSIQGLDVWKQDFRLKIPEAQMTLENVYELLK